MIAFVRGTVCDITADAVIVEQGGIGFRVFVPASESARMDINTEVRLYTYLRVAEDDLSLFGFLTKDALELFRMLISVNGIGPKGAMAILGTMSADELRFAIAAEDAKAISAAPGIGAKTAQRVILDLRDKIDYVSAIETAVAQPVRLADEPSAQQEAIQALVALGYSSAEAMRSLRNVDTEGMTTEDIIRIALRNI